VHRIVENHGGDLQFESRLNVGTTFRIRLPNVGNPGESRSEVRV